MTRSTLYPPANRTQWYSGGQYGGSTMELAAPVVVLHSTEGGGWPAYSGGAVAPTLTYWPIAPGNCQWRQHFRINESGRALMNKAGGVQTNTAGAVQVELVGTCDPGTLARIPGLMFWPSAPDWALEPLADFLTWMHNEWGLPLESTSRPWLSYPSSYGNSAARMSFTEWDNFSGVCGHQHVPENDHGDPGNINIARLLQLASPGKPAKPSNVDNGAPAKPVPTPPPTPLQQKDNAMLVVEYNGTQYDVNLFTRTYRAMPGGAITSKVASAVSGRSTVVLKDGDEWTAFNALFAPAAPAPTA